MKSKQARSAAYYLPYHPYAVPSVPASVVSALPALQAALPVTTASSALSASGATAANGLVANGLTNGLANGLANGVANGVAGRQQYLVTPPASYYEPQMPHVAPGKKRVADDDSGDVTLRPGRARSPSCSPPRWSV